MRRVLVLALTATFAALAMMPAHAEVVEPRGRVTWEPASGSVYAGIWATSEGPCPEEATNLYGRLSGPGFAKEGIVVIPTSPVGLSTTGPMTMPVQNTLYNFAGLADLDRLDGIYTFEFVCTDDFGVAVLDRYTMNVAINQGEDEPLDAAVYETGPGVGANDGTATGTYVIAGAGLIAVAGAAVAVVQRRRRASSEASG